MSTPSSCVVRLFRALWRRKRGGAAAMLALAALAGCARRETAVQRADRAGLMLIGNGAEPGEIDPQLITGIPETNIADALFEGLVTTDPRTLRPMPGVAESWEVSPDGRVYTFHLRADAKWSDGAPVTAEDFAASFQRILTPALGSQTADQLYYLAGAEAYHAGRTKDFSTVGVRALDARTLRLTLTNPTPFFPQLLSDRYWYPVPMAVLRKFGGLTRQGTAWTRPENFVGNGAFVLKEWKPNEYILVTKSPTYWDRAHVRLNGVKFFPIEDANVEEGAFRSGQLHKTEQVPLAKIAVYRRDHPELLRIAPYSAVYYYSFNVNRAPFTDVRRALAMAIDRVSLVRDVTRGGELPAYNFTPAGIGGYVCATHIRYDPAAARALLAEAGYPGGRGFPKVALLYNTSENHRLIAEAIQQQWRENLHIDITLTNEEWKVYLDSTHMQNYQVCRAGLVVDPYDPYLYLRTFIKGSGFNNTGWSSPEYDRLFQEAAQSTDQARRLALDQQMEALLLRDMPIIPIYFYTNHYLLRTDVKDWSDNLLGRFPLSQAWLEN